MKKLFNFKCESGQVFEKLVNDKQLNIKCKCGKMAYKAISAARYLGNSTGKSPARH